MRTMIVNDNDHDILFDDNGNSELVVSLGEGVHEIFMNGHADSVFVEVKFDKILCVAGGTNADSPVVFMERPEFSSPATSPKLVKYEGTNAQRVFVVTTAVPKHFKSEEKVKWEDVGKMFVLSLDKKGGPVSVLSCDMNVQFRVNVGSLQIISDPCRYDLVTHRGLVSGKISESLMSQIKGFDMKPGLTFSFIHGIENFLSEEPGSVRVIFDLPSYEIVENKNKTMKVLLKPKEGWSFQEDGEEKKTSAKTLEIPSGDQKNIFMIHNESGIKADVIRIMNTSKVVEENHHDLLAAGIAGGLLGVAVMISCAKLS